MSTGDLPTSPEPSEPIYSADGSSPMPPPSVDAPDGVLTVLPAPRPPHPGFWWSLLWCIGFLLVTQIPGAVIIVIGIVAAFLMHIDEYKDVLQSHSVSAMSQFSDKIMQSDLIMIFCIIGLAVTELLGILVSWLVIRLVVGREWKRQLALTLPSLTHAALTVLTLPAAIILCNAVASLVPSPEWLPDFEKEMTKLFANWPWAIAVLIIGVGPGIGEEMWCRGFLGRGLVGRHGYALGVILTSFLFGLIHLYPRQAVGAAAVGLVLHFIYLTTRSLLLPMLLHFLFNASAVLATSANGPRIPGLKSLEEASNKNLLLLCLGAAILLAAVAWALYQSRARLQPTGEHTSPWKPDYPGVAYPPPGSGTIVVRPALGLSMAMLVALAVGLFGSTCYLATIWSFP